MQIIWLRAFLALVHTNSFSAAADELFVSQSTISKYIQSIEREMHTRLFTRTSRSILLTEAGEDFHDYAEHIVASYDSMRHAMEKYAEQKENVVRIGCITVAHLYGYSGFFYKFIEEHPSMEVQMQDLTMPEILKAIADGSCDFALLRTNLLESSEDYHILYMRDENLNMVCSKKHPLANRREISIHEVCENRLVFQKYSLEEIKLLLLKQYGIKESDLKICGVTTRNSILRAYLRDALGVGIMSRSFMATVDTDDELVAIPITEQPKFELGLIYRKRRLSPVGSRFINYVRESLAETKSLPSIPDDNYLDT